MIWSASKTWHRDRHERDRPLAPTHQKAWILAYMHIKNATWSLYERRTGSERTCIYKHLLRLSFFSLIPQFFLRDSKSQGVLIYDCSLLFFFPKTCQFDVHDRLGSLRKTTRVNGISAPLSLSQYHHVHYHVSSSRPCSQKIIKLCSLLCMIVPPPDFSYRHPKTLNIIIIISSVFRNANLSAHDLL